MASPPGRCNCQLFHYSMKTITTLSIVVLLLTNCSENNRKDTTVVQAPEEERISVVEEKTSLTSTSLVDLSKEKNIQSLLCQGWIMDDDIAVINENGDAEGMYPVRCFYLFDDFTYTRNVRNYMEYGKWEYNNENKKLIFKTSAGSRDEYKIAAIGPDDMIVINSEENSITKLTFIGSSYKYKNKNDDPYFIDNNRWRIKPNFSETDEQVRKRLKDCIHFYILFYKDNLARESKKISFYGFPTCIKWYGGGIYMVKEKELADNWFNCFYNKEQAMKAYRIMEKVIMKEYKWNKGKVSWVKKNLEVLQQMYENI